MTRLTLHNTEAYLAAQCFDTGPTGFVGASVQVLPVALIPVEPPPGQILEPLRHGHLSGELGGVLEVSIPPSPGLDIAVRRLAVDLTLARALLARHGLAPGERAVDTHRPFSADSDLRRGTASVRVRVDAGATHTDMRRRWETAQAVGPVLAAAFANSPLRAGRPTGWHSTRQAMRLAIDTPLNAGEPTSSWADEARAAATHLPADPWTGAARDALTDPLLAEAARTCFLAAYASLARQGADRRLRDDVATFIHRYVSRGRTPADDLLDVVRTPT